MDDFSKLIRLVRKLGDGELADWMRDKARSLPSFAPTHRLVTAFRWSECPFSEVRVSRMDDKISRYIHEKRLTKKTRKMLEEVRQYVPRAYHILLVTMGTVKTWRDTDRLTVAFDWAATGNGYVWWREVWEDLLRNVPRYRHTQIPSLIEKVSSVDSEAAQWLVENCARLRYFVPSDNLVECFSWEDTPQGFEFWRSIAVDIEDMEDYEESDLDLDDYI